MLRLARSEASVTAATPLTSAVTPAVVIGSGLGALGALRLLNRAAIPTYSLTAEPSVESRSRWFCSVPGVREPLRNEASLAQLLETCSLDHAVLIPCSDSAVNAICQFPRGLARRFPSSTPPSAVTTQLSNKAEFARLLCRLGVPRPRTLVVGDGEDLEQFAGGHFEHFFLKPVDSASFALRYGVKGCRVRTLADARTQLSCLEADGQAVVVQEYVPGPPSSYFLIDGFSDSRGEICALFARRRIRMFPAGLGNSTCMVSVPLSEVEPAARVLRTILSTIRYRGIFSAEFKKDARDGALKILEINARVWIYVEFTGRCGVDVCTMAYRDALGLPLGLPQSYRAGARLVLPYGDLAAAYGAWQHGQLAVGAWLSSWIGAQQPHFNWSDPAPAMHEWSNICGRILRRTLRRRPAVA